MSTTSDKQSFWYGALAGVAANFVALQWAAAWLVLGFFGAGMSSQPADELNQLMQSFVVMATCCPAALNLILFAVGAALRKPLFWGGCLAGLLVNVLLAVCLATLFGGMIFLLAQYP
jgi:predicted permease